MERTYKHRPTFFYRKTKRGIITSTYPVISELKFGENQLEYFDYSRGIKTGLWHPDVEFVFFPKTKIDTYTYLNTSYNSIHMKRVCPISKSHLIEGRNYFPDLDDAKVYWGSEISSDDYHKTQDVFETEVLYTFFDWYNKVGKKNKYDYIRELNSNWYCDYDLVKHRDVFFSKDKVSFEMLNFLFGISYLKAYIRSGELIELDFLIISGRFNKKKEFYDTANYDYYETTREINIRFTKYFQIDFVEYVCENKIKQKRPDGKSWKDWNSDTREYKGDPLCRYYPISVFDSVFSKKYFTMSKETENYSVLVMFSSEDIKDKKLTIQMSQDEIWHEEQNEKNKEDDDYDYWQNRNPNSWMGDNFDEFVDFD